MNSTGGGDEPAEGLDERRHDGLQVLLHERDIANEPCGLKELDRAVPLDIPQGRR